MKNSIRIAVFVALMILYSALAARNPAAAAAFFGAVLLSAFIFYAESNR